MDIQIGQMPKEVIWIKSKARLYHYVPVRKKRYRLPLLFIYGLINRCSILDLLPGNSLVEYLVRQGFDVYLLDWGSPDAEDNHLAFAQYILDYIASAVQQVLAYAGVQECSMLGYCMGGTMSAMYAALFPASALRNLILLATPIDFAVEHTGLYGILLNQQCFNLDLLVATLTPIPGELITIGNFIIKILATSLSEITTGQEHIPPQRSEQTTRALQRWANEAIPFAGAAFRQWIRDFYQSNSLIKGEIRLREQQVNLSRISCSVLNIAGKRDRICTLPQTETTLSLISSPDREFFVLDTGHVGLLADTEAQERLFPKIRTWLEPRSH